MQKLTKNLGVLIFLASLAAIFNANALGSNILFPAKGKSSNLPPTFAEIPDQAVAEQSTLTLAISAADPEGNPVTIRARNLKSWMSFSDNLFTAAPSINDSGTYTLSFSASDGAQVSTYSFNLTVTNLNQAPVLNPLVDRSVNEGGSISFPVVATDPDGNLLTIVAEPLLSWMAFDGQVFTANPGFDVAGSYVVTFTASDSQYSVSDDLVITVNNVNQAPWFDMAGNYTVTENMTLTLPINAIDPDGDDLIITPIGLQPWMDFDGEVFTASPDYGDAGSYTVNFMADDGSARGSLTLTLSVTDSNRPPELVGLKDWTIGDGKVLSFPVVSSDSDGDSVTVAGAGLQSWMSFDGKTFRARPKAGTLGTYTLTFTASDQASSSSQTISVSVTPEGGSFPAPWTDYLGSVGAKADWTSWLRHWLVGVTGMSLVDDPTLVSQLEATASDDLATHDLMLPITTFVRDSALMAEFLDLIEYGGIEDWQEAVRAEVETLSRIDPSGENVFYQLGNEITTERISNNLRDWAASRGMVIEGSAQAYDPELIAYYVEYFLAPTVEKVLEASELYFGDPNVAIIVLGSIGNGGSKDARDWLDLLLDYEVQGTFVPSLTGKHVYELVDLISVHYVGANDALEDIWSRWAGVGRIKGLWTTEELGSKAADAGGGAGRAIYLAGEQLGWFYQRALTPEQSRVAFYDWDVEGLIAGTSADESMSVLYDFLGEAPLEVFNDEALLDGVVDELHTVSYNSLLDDNKRVLSVVPGDSPLSSDALVSAIHFSKNGWSGPVTAIVHQFGPSGYSQLVGSVRETADDYTLTLTTPALLVDDAAALLITLQH